MKLKILALFIFVYVLSGSFVSAQSKTVDALQKLVRQMVEAQRAYNAPALDKILTADYIEISPLGEFDPRDKVFTFYQPELKPANMQVKNDADEFSIRSYGKFAIVIVRLNYMVTMEGKSPPPRSIRATFVCRKEKGVWKIASAQYTGIRPSAPPQNKTD